MWLGRRRDLLRHIRAGDLPLRRSPAAFLHSPVLRIAPALIYSSATIASLLPMHLRSLLLFPKGPWIEGAYWTPTIEAVFYALTCFLIVTGWIDRLQTVALAASLLVLGFYLMVTTARVWPEL